jgi:pimeloyl-ACP methyl ester carboxylesterase
MTTSCNDDADGDNELVSYHYYTPTGDGENETGLAILFCNGFRSSMSGKKAMIVQEYCQKNRLSFCRFDYRGHGESSTEDFLQLTLSDWMKDAEMIIKHVLFKNNNNAIILVGSSMGAWIAIHLALWYPQNIVGIIGIAPAIDFTEDIYRSATTSLKADWANRGLINLPSRYDAEPYPITWNLIDDAKKKWCLLDRKTIPISCPVRLLHGQNDEDVPWDKSLRLSNLLESDDVILTLIKSGDHRLSTPRDLERILHSVDELVMKFSTSNNHERKDDAKLKDQ